MRNNEALYDDGIHQTVTMHGLLELRIFMLPAADQVERLVVPSIGLRPCLEEPNDASPILTLLSVFVP